MKSQRRLSRRNLLRGAGGALTLPFLEGLQRANAAPGDKPLRLVVFFHEAGIMPGEFVPTQTGTDYELTPMLEPLAAHRDKMVVVSGLTNLAADHEQSTTHISTKVSVLTGASGYPGPGEEHWANGPSIDQILADRLPITPRKTIDILVGEKEVWYEGVVTFAGPNLPVTTRFNDPTEMFNQLFGDFTPGGSPEQSQLVAERLSVLDAVRGNFASYRRKLSGADRERLDAHESYIRDIEQRLQADVASGCVAPEPPPMVDFVNDVEPAFRAHVDVLVQALACDISRVAVVYPHTQQIGRFGDLEVPGGTWHLFLHTGDGDVVSDQPALRRQIFQWHYHQLAYLLQRMDEVDDGDGTLLDNSLVLSISDYGNGALHDYGWGESIPVILAGGLGGALTTGRHVSYPEHTTNDLHTSILNLFGFDDTSFGESQYCTGPLAGLAG